MKKYIITSVALLALVSCDIQSGGNKNIVKRSATQPRYDDDMKPAAQEPNFAPDQSKRRAITDSVRMAGGEVITKSSVSTPAEPTSSNAETTANEAMEEASTN